MLGKLLKYDLKSIFRYWWIAGISSLVLSFFGGGCITLLKSERTLPDFIYGITILALVLIIIGIAVFSILTMILILVRFYRNLFTDEGYLTFTLPVKRSELLNSKLITSLIFMFSTVIICFIDIAIMLGIGFAEEIFTKEFLETVRDIVNHIIDAVGFYGILYIIEIIALLVLSVLFSTLFIYICITFASIITKKAKVITAIGIYYAANSIFSFGLQIFYLFGMQSLVKWFGVLPTDSLNLTVTLVLLGLIFFMAVICSMLYALQYWMLDRKLNLN